MAKGGIPENIAAFLRQHGNDVSAGYVEQVAERCDLLQAQLDAERKAHLETRAECDERYENLRESHRKNFDKKIADIASSIGKELEDVYTQLEAYKAQCERLEVERKELTLGAYTVGEIEARAIESLQFPVVLRKMWSGNEIQQWLNDKATRLRQQAKEEDEPNNNQCDGCQKGHQILNGVHVNNDGYPYMACQRNRYEQAAQADKGVGGEND